MAGERFWGRVAAALAVAVMLAWPESLAAQAPPAKPPAKPDAPAESGQKAPPPAKRPPPSLTPPPPPPPQLLLTSDMACRVELDGEVIAELEKDVVQKVRVKPGEHLIQAFPLELVGGPTWKDVIDAPETGTVSAIIELEEAVAKWRKEREKAEVEVRFDTSLAGTVVDNDSALMWTSNVSPAIQWEDALTYCDRLRHAGFDDWRLPSLDELSKLYFPDHEAPLQETSRGEGDWTIFGKKKGDMEVLPRLIHPPFEHNSVARIWVRGSEERVACGFLGQFGCAVERKKEQAAVFCVRPVE